MAIPEHPKIYHITHVNNLHSIVSDHCLWSDRKRIARSIDCRLVGMSSIKNRRLKLEVKCHPGTTVGEYVPFYFCPRSIMLYILHKGNHQDLEYTEGQRPIVHLQADLRTVVDRARRTGIRWAFTDGNAGAAYTAFYDQLTDLGKINWTAVQANDFRPSEIKEGKQAELLVYESFPWSLVERIGVAHADLVERVEAVIAKASHRPEVAVETGWYY